MEMILQKNPTQALVLIQNSVNPNPLVPGKGQEKAFHSHCWIRFATPEEDMFSEWTLFSL